MCGTRRARTRRTGPARSPRPRPPSSLSLEQELHADADPEHGPAGGDAIADRLVEAVGREPARRALDVADPGDHRERRVAHDVAASIVIDALRACAGERRA